MEIMRYYDLVQTPLTGKTFSEDGENRVIETDESVISWFTSVDLTKYGREFDTGGYPILKEYELDIEGARYRHYTEVEGVYVVDTEAEAEAEANSLALEVKASKDLELTSLVVNVNTVPFDSDNQSINYMSSVIAVANFKFNQAVASGTTELAAYDEIYKTVIQWRNANNTVSDVQIETVAEALEVAMVAVGSVKTGT